MSAPAKASAKVRRAPLGEGAGATGEEAAGAGTFSISDLSQEFGITTRTIRFYESRGLISPARSGYTRRYTKRDRARLMLILRGRNLGFTVEDVADYLALYDSDPGQIAQTQLLLDKVSAALEDLKTKRRDIDRALADLAEIKARCEAHLKRR